MLLWLVADSFCLDSQWIPSNKGTIDPPKKKEARVQIFKGTPGCLSMIEITRFFTHDFQEQLPISYSQVILWLVYKHLVRPCLASRSSHKRTVSKDHLFCKGVTNNKTSKSRKTPENHLFFMQFCSVNHGNAATSQLPKHLEIICGKKSSQLPTSQIS